MHHRISRKAMVVLFDNSIDRLFFVIVPRIKPELPDCVFTTIIHQYPPLCKAGSRVLNTDHYIIVSFINVIPSALPDKSDKTCRRRVDINPVYRSVAAQLAQSIVILLVGLLYVRLPA